MSNVRPQRSVSVLHARAIIARVSLVPLAHGPTTFAGVCPRAKSNEHTAWWKIRVARRGRLCASQSCATCAWPYVLRQQAWHRPSAGALCQAGCPRTKDQGAWAWAARPASGRSAVVCHQLQRGPEEHGRLVLCPTERSATMGEMQAIPPRFPVRRALRPNPSFEGTSYGLCPPAAPQVKR